MYRRILVPLDGSPLGEVILEDVEGLAKGGEAEVILLRVGQTPQRVVVDNGRVIYLDEQRAWIEREMEDYLVPVERRLRARGLRVRRLIGFGDPVEEILCHAEEEGVGLIAMSTHARSGLGALLHRNVAQKVYHRASVPVLLKRVEERVAALARAA